MASEAVLAGIEGKKSDSEPDVDLNVRGVPIRLRSEDGKVHLGITKSRVQENGSRAYNACYISRYM